jgi:NHL repeat
VQSRDLAALLRDSRIHPATLQHVLRRPEAQIVYVIGGRWPTRGKQIATWGKHGKGQREFDQPHGIAMDSQGRIFVADRGNSRLPTRPVRVLEGFGVGGSPDIVARLIAQWLWGATGHSSSRTGPGPMAVLRRRPPRGRPLTDTRCCRPLPSRREHIIVREAHLSSNVIPRQLIIPRRAAC